MLAHLLLFAITLSIDSFGVGITYGIRNTKISIVAKFLLFLIAFFVVLFSLSIGVLILPYLPTWFATLLGSFLLCLMGLWMIYQSFQPDKEIEAKEKSFAPKTIQFFIKSFGITVKIIRDPRLSDFDDSQMIDSKEAIYLGFAMSADSFVCGMGFSMIGNFSFLFPIFVAIFQLLFLSLGNYLGKKIKSISHLPPTIWSRISGFLLILLGILKIWF